MKAMRLLKLTGGFCLLFGASACALFSKEATLPEWHPEELKEHHVQCSECHEDRIRGILKKYDTFNHTSNFIRRHRYFAAHDSFLCNSCHEHSFCVDCHATKGAVPPIDRFGTGDDLEFDHRGDYLTRHMTDGKIDPTACYRCHGRSNNEMCRRCHRGGQP